MLKKSEIQELIAICQLIGQIGLKNGVSAQIPKLHIDVLKSSSEFIGVSTNPAIFINKSTYKYLGKYHPNWVVNETIAVKAAFLKQSSKLEIIGALVHEIGHAFNVNANIANTEANAYIFEIEALCNLSISNLEFLGKLSYKDMHNYFKTRFQYYRRDISTNSYLAGLVEKINEHFHIDPELKSTPKIKTGKLDYDKSMFFKKPSNLDSEIALAIPTFN